MEAKGGRTGGKVKCDMKYKYAPMINMIVISSYFLYPISGYVSKSLLSGINFMIAAEEST